MAATEIAETPRADNLRQRRVLSTTEYAGQSGLSEATVRRACERKEIVAIRIGRRWLIPIDELDRRLAKAGGDADKTESKGGTV
jgi:excisionase family DNA binding protein